MATKKDLIKAMSRHVTKRYMAEHASINLTEEKERDQKLIRNLNASIFITSKFRKGSGGSDTPSLQMSISLTPGKAIELKRAAADDVESEKLATAIKFELERLFRAFDKKYDDIIKKYSLSAVTDDVPEPEPAEVPKPDVATPKKPAVAPSPTPKATAKLSTPLQQAPRTAQPTRTPQAPKVPGK